MNNLFRLCIFGKDMHFLNEIFHEISTVILKSKENNPTFLNPGHEINSPQPIIQYNNEVDTQQNKTLSPTTIHTASTINISTGMKIVQCF